MMAGLASDVTPTPASAARSAFRRKRIVVVILVLALGLAVGITLLHLDDRYGPISTGAFGGPYASRNLIVSPDGSSVRLASAPGATADLLESVENTGAHSVTITSIDTDGIVTAIRWSTYRMVPGGYVSGVETPWHSFPAVIPAHGTLRLLVTIHRSNAYCQATQPGTLTAYYTGQHLVHWESLLRSHASTIGGDLDGRMIQIC